MGNRYADHVTPLYPQKLALTSPTGGGRSVGIVHSRTKATEFSLVYCHALSMDSFTWGIRNNIYEIFVVLDKVGNYYYCRRCLSSCRLEDGMQNGGQRSETKDYYVVFLQSR